MFRENEIKPVSGFVALVVLLALDTAAVWTFAQVVQANALDQWQSIGPNGQARYRDIAIETCLMLRAAWRWCT